MIPMYLQIKPQLANTLLSKQIKGQCHAYLHTRININTGHKLINLYIKSLNENTLP